MFFTGFDSRRSMLCAGEGKITVCRRGSPHAYSKDHDNPSVSTLLSITSVVEEWQYVYQERPIKLAFQSERFILQNLFSPPGEPIFLLLASCEVASLAGRWHQASAQAGWWACISQNRMLYSLTAVSCEAALQAQQYQLGMGSDVC